MYIKKMKNGKRKSRAAIGLFLAVFLFSIQSQGQCAMCRAALEGEGNAAQAEAVNDGIVYLMVIPYLLVAVIGYYIYKTQRKPKAE